MTEQALSPKDEFYLQHIKPMTEEFFSGFVTPELIDLGGLLCMCGLATADYTFRFIESEEEQESIHKELVSLAISTCLKGGHSFTYEFTNPCIDIDELWPLYSYNFPKLVRYAVDHELQVGHVLELLALFAGNNAFNAREMATPEHWISCYTMGIGGFPYDKRAERFS